MSATSPSPADDPAHDWERALLDRQLAALSRLAEMGMAIAGVIERTVTAEAPPPENVLQHAAIDFARVSRAVRLTFAMQSRLIADFKKPPPRPADNAAPDDDEEDEEDDGGVDVSWFG